MISFLKVVLQKCFGLLGYKLVKKLDAKNENTIKRNKVLNKVVTEPFSSVPFASEALECLIDNYEFSTVLDIGSGEGRHSDIFKMFGKTVTSIDFGKSIYFEKREGRQKYIRGDYYTYEFDEKFDVIWASHVLEHQPNPNLFLKKIHNDLNEGGILALTVPPLKHEIVGGHLTLWNAGLLIYQLVLAGFNCKSIAIKSYGYNISIILKKDSVLKYPKLSYDSGDIKKLINFFPDNFTEPFDGDIKELNWPNFK